MARILIIDDDNDIRVMLKQMLDREGYEVFIASDGKEGIKLHKEKNADLIITDIIMSEKEGIETIKELRQEFPDLKIIAMSGGGRIGADAYLKVAKNLGAKITFTKPINKNDLIKAIKNILG